MTKEETLEKLKTNLTKRNWYKAKVVLVDDEVLEEFIVNGIEEISIDGGESEIIVLGIPKDHSLNGGLGNGIFIRISHIRDISVPYLDLLPLEG